MYYPPQLVDINMDQTCRDFLLERGERYASLFNVSLHKIQRMFSYIAVTDCDNNIDLSFIKRGFEIDPLNKDLFNNHTGGFGAYNLCISLFNEICDSAWHLIAGSIVLFAAATAVLISEVRHKWVADMISNHTSLARLNDRDRDTVMNTAKAYNIKVERDDDLGSLLSTFEDHQTYLKKKARRAYFCRLEVVKGINSPLSSLNIFATDPIKEPKLLNTVFEFAGLKREIASRNDDPSEDTSEEAADRIAADTAVLAHRMV